MGRKILPILAALGVLLLASLACEFSATTASIASAVLSKEENAESPTQVFAPEDVFYCIVETKNAPDDTVVKAVWTAVDVEGSDLNTKILEKEITSGSSTLTFNLSNDNPWPAGKYKVDLYLNDKLDRTLAFEVE